MIVYLVSDLIWETRIRSAAQAVGVEAMRVRQADELHKLFNENEVELFLVDLEAEGALEAVSAAAEQAEDTRIVAWAPHVAATMLEQARAAGAGDVLARGAFARQLASLVESVGSRG